MIISHKIKESNKRRVSVNLAALVHSDAEQLHVWQSSKTEEVDVQWRLGVVLVNEQEILIQPQHHLHRQVQYNVIKQSSSGCDGPPCQQVKCWFIERIVVKRPPLCAHTKVK